MWKRTDVLINTHNGAQNDYVLGHNFFSDMTLAERRLYKGLTPTQTLVGPGHRRLQEYGNYVDGNDGYYPSNDGDITPDDSSSTSTLSLTP